MPFSGPSGVGDAKVQLEQVRPKWFKLLVGFHFTREDGSNEFEVTPAELGLTDLTSVPFALRWFVNSYGRHTLPALLHDCLIEEQCALAASKNRPPTRSEADDIFLEALDEQEVPLLRRHLMWSAVTFNTRATHSGIVSTLVMIAWVLAAVAGTVAVFGNLWWGFSWFRALAVLGPIPFCLLWGAKWRAGIWFGYGVVFLAPAALVVYASFLVYWIVERVLPTSDPPSPRRF